MSANEPQGEHVTTAEKWLGALSGVVCGAVIGAVSGLFLGGLVSFLVEEFFEGDVKLPRPMWFWGAVGLGFVLGVRGYVRAARRPAREEAEERRQDEERRDGEAFARRVGMEATLPGPGMEHVPEAGLAGRLGEMLRRQGLAITRLFRRQLGTDTIILCDVAYETADFRSTVDEDNRWLPQTLVCLKLGSGDLGSFMLQPKSFMWKLTLKWGFGYEQVQFRGQSKFQRRYQVLSPEPDAVETEDGNRFFRFLYTKDNTAGVPRGRPPHGGYFVRLDNLGLRARSAASFRYRANGVSDLRIGLRLSNKESVSWLLDLPPAGTWKAMRLPSRESREKLVFLPWSAHATGVAFTTFAPVFDGNSGPVFLDLDDIGIE